MPQAFLPLLVSRCMHEFHIILSRVSSHLGRLSLKPLTTEQTTAGLSNCALSPQQPRKQQNTQISSKSSLIPPAQCHYFGPMTGRARAF